MFGRCRGAQRDFPGNRGNILRHQASERGFRAAAAPDGAIREAFDAHVERFLGEDYLVWHEIGSDTIHLDVYLWRPTAERPFFTFVTSGMSDLPMSVPDGAVRAGVTDLAELMVCLPADWPVPTQGTVPWGDDATYFPVRWLKALARLPCEYGTWLGFGHSVPHGDPAKPLTEGTAAVGWLLLPPITLPDEARSLPLPDGRRLDLFALIALTAAELDRKLDQGPEALFEGFDAAGVNEVLDVHRASTV